MTSSQRIHKMIKLSANTTNCTYKHTEGDIWPAIPREMERFNTSKEFSQIDIQIFNHLLETPKPENEVDIEDGYSDFDDTDEDPDYRPGRPNDVLLPTEDEHFENDIVVADHPSDNNETESRNVRGILILILYIIIIYLSNLHNQCYDLHII